MGPRLREDDVVVGASPCGLREPENALGNAYVGVSTSSHGAC